MSNVGKKERETQNRLLKLFRKGLDYDYLGNWEDRPGNSNVEEEVLIKWQKRKGHEDKIISKVLYELDNAKALGGSKNLYDANREVYGLLRYGVKVKPEAGEQNLTVWLVDWKNPSNNHFAIAEEVTVAGVHDKRPDLVLYLNGIAVGVIELKRSIISVTEGIRQNLDNQTKSFIRPFYATVQLVMAGNDTEGLRYGVIETPVKHYLSWKEDSAIDNPLDKAITQLCNKERLLEVIHNFMVFDAGTKKTCRHNQYFGVQAAQQAVKKREGGIIWHTQGSGKSLTMVWLAKWIREHVRNARVLLITDRTELDEQIEKVFKGVDEDTGYVTNLNGTYNSSGTGTGFGGPNGSPAGPCIPTTGSAFPEGDVELTLFDAWTADVMRIACIDTTGHVIYLTSPTKYNGGIYNFLGPTVNHRYIIENSRTAFFTAQQNGQTGLWYLDKSTTPWTLDYIANSGENPFSDTIIIPQLGSAFPSGTSDPVGGSLLSATGLSYVTFSGITFEIDNNTPLATNFVTGVGGGFNTDDNGESNVPRLSIAKAANSSLSTV